MKKKIISGVETKEVSLYLRLETARLGIIHDVNKKEELKKELEDVITKKNVMIEARLRRFDPTYRAERVRLYEGGPLVNLSLNCRLNDIPLVARTLAEVKPELLQSEGRDALGREALLSMPLASEALPVFGVRVSSLKHENFMLSNKVNVLNQGVHRYKPLILNRKESSGLVVKNSESSAAAAAGESVVAVKNHQSVSDFSKGSIGVGNSRPAAAAAGESVVAGKDYQSISGFYRQSIGLEGSRPAAAAAGESVVAGKDYQSNFDYYRQLGSGNSRPAAAAAGEMVAGKDYHTPSTFYQKVASQSHSRGALADDSSLAVKDYLAAIDRRKNYKKPDSLATSKLSVPVAEEYVPDIYRIRLPRQAEAIRVDKYSIVDAILKNFVSVDSKATRGVDGYHFKLHMEQAFRGLYTCELKKLKRYQENFESYIKLKRENVDRGIYDFFGLFNHGTITLLLVTFFSSPHLEVMMSNLIEFLVYFRPFVFTITTVFFWAPKTLDQLYLYFRTMLMELAARPIRVDSAVNEDSRSADLREHLSRAFDSQDVREIIIEEAVVPRDDVSIVFQQAIEDDRSAALERVQSFFINATFVGVASGGLFLAFRNRGTIFSFYRLFTNPVRSLPDLAVGSSEVPGLVNSLDISNENLLLDTNTYEGLMQEFLEFLFSSGF